MKNLRILNKEEGGTLIAFLATIFGGFVRLYPAGISGFPINDGGLFVAMIEAINANGLRLPLYIQYNNVNIPFAYPPFAFFIGAFLSSFFHFNPIDIVHWIPGIVTVFTVPAFYYLARILLNSSYQAGLATVAFAFTPRTFTWSIMGGGLTRSFGLLFLLLSLGYIYRLFKERDRKHLLASILFSALVILAHPEAAIHTVGIALLIWLFVGRDRQGIINGLLLVVGITIVTSIWWLPTIINLGLNPFLAAAHTGSRSALAILYPFILSLTDEPFLTIVAVLGVIGFFVCLANKNYLIPIMYFVPYLVDPRSGATYSMIPLSLMGGVALSEVILPVIARLDSSKNATGRDNPLLSPTAIAFLIITSLYMLGGTLYFGAQLTGSTLSEADRAAINWTRENTSKGSRFLIMTGESQILCDSVQEWFPVLSNDVSITTIQGNEWLPDDKYARAVTLQTGVQSCMEGSSPLDCIEKYRLQFEYIYIKRQETLKNFCRVTATISRGNSLIAALLENGQYHLVYQSDAVIIFSGIH